MRANKISLLAIALVVATASYAWKPAGTKIMTKWGEALTSENVLPEYPLFTLHIPTTQS